MNHLFSMVSVFLLLTSCLFVADSTFTVTAQTTETPASEEAGKQKERGYRLPTRITVVYWDEDVIAEKGIPEWTAEAVNVIREYYPKYDKYLETEGHLPPGTMELQAHRSGPIGWNNGAAIGFSIRWIKPGAGGENDWGMIVHEMVHYIQNYRSGEAKGLPYWAIEGIADFMRYAFYEPESEMLPVDPNMANYNDGHQVTAGFFMYIVDTYDTDFIKKLNRAARQLTYSGEMYEQNTGKKPDILWAEYVEKVLKPLQQENKRLVPAARFPNVMRHIKEFEEHFSTLKPEPLPRPQQASQ